jgi:hypothetical protein
VKLVDSTLSATTATEGGGGASAVFVLEDAAALVPPSAAGYCRVSIGKEHFSLRRSQEAGRAVWVAVGVIAAVREGIAVALEVPHVEEDAEAEKAALGVANEEGDGRNSVAVARGSALTEVEADSDCGCVPLGEGDSIMEMRDEPVVHTLAEKLDAKVKYGVREATLVIDVVWLEKALIDPRGVLVAIEDAEEVSDGAERSVKRGKTLLVPSIGEVLADMDTDGEAEEVLDGFEDWENFADVEDCPLGEESMEMLGEDELQNDEDVERLIEKVLAPDKEKVPLWVWSADGNAEKEEVLLTDWLTAAVSEPLERALAEGTDREAWGELVIDAETEKGIDRVERWVVTALIDWEAWGLKDERERLGAGVKDESELKEVVRVPETRLEDDVESELVNTAVPLQFAERVSAGDAEREGVFEVDFVAKDVMEAQPEEETEANTLDSGVEDWLRDSVLATVEEEDTHDELLRVDEKVVDADTVGENVKEAVGVTVKEGKLEKDKVSVAVKKLLAVVEDVGDALKAVPGVEGEEVTLTVPLREADGEVVGETLDVALGEAVDVAVKAALAVE